MARSLFAALLLALTISTFPAMAEEGPTIITLAHAQVQDAAADPAAATASEFRRQLGDLSSGSLKIAIYPDSQLGGNRDMAKLVAKGVVQSALVSVGGLAPLYPPIAVTAMPFALDNPQAAYALYDGPFGQGLSANIESKADLVVLGYGDSISYDQLVQRITGDALDKSHRFTDWTRRPLSEAQLSYAISDVTHLRDVYLKLAADLEKQGRSSWVKAEMDVLTSPETYRADPDRGRRVQSVKRCDLSSVSPVMRCTS